MRIIRCSIVLLPLALGSLGCFSTPKAKSPTSQNTSPTATVPFWKQTDPKRPAPTLAIPGNNSEDANARPASDQTSYNGVLAGTLVDSFGKLVPRAYIQVAAADAVGGKPIEISVYNGYFTIPGLTPGRSYMLTARTSTDGEQKLAGRMQAIPPQSRLVIKMSEDLYSPNIPPPPAPAILGARTGGVTGASGFDDGPHSPPLSDSPYPERALGDFGARPDPPPRGLNQVPNAPATPPPQLDPTPDDHRIPPMGTFHPENIADRDLRRPAPITNVPGPGPTPPRLPDPDPPPSGSSPGPGAFRYSDQPRVPSCEFSGRKLVNFALNDLNGRPWEFQQHHGRLVLLDFWGTWCAPCVRAIPHLKKLQTEYGAYGLEVVGIACERTSEPERTRKVREVSDRQQINYRVLLAEDFDECPVQQKFRIERYPTLVLLDATGNVLWRGSADGLAQLEQTIRQQLRVAR